MQLLPQLLQVAYSSSKYMLLKSAWTNATLDRILEEDSLVLLGPVMSLIDTVGMP